ncbi:hypothetical protein EH31_03160 [Erythrobacter longus]|uniref:Uncharacterized protein n=1 Tax=Erythrobacter longus TaxID=1044 RepID=A0A074MFX3_ERYLO|nr:hypothetical protein [Erythrobacter longus]KEO91685.1 hypothetical protein EH31_03160 [Erythrobacter longus]
MNSDALMVILLLVSGALIQVAATLGCVLLTKLWLGRFSRGVRTMIAALSGCLVMVSPVMIVGIADESFGGWGEFFGVIAVLLFFCMVVAWLPAHFVTRRLDQLTEFDIETFT